MNKSDDSSDDTSDESVTVSLHSPPSGRSFVCHRRSGSTPSLPSPLLSPCGSPVRKQTNRPDGRPVNIQDVRLSLLRLSVGTGNRSLDNSLLPSSGQQRYTYNSSQHWKPLRLAHLDGLSEAALPQHLSVDEVGRAEDPVRPIGPDAERLRSVAVPPPGGRGGGGAGVW